ncbi:hypothetical protein RJT34_26927 [Clitoria ternatea]|uniref:Uncharacterized protein n=1 Tax=Clitoria ternatea TaxID=43366 RepID=A0AAN9F7Q8_CLITE
MIVDFVPVCGSMKKYKRRATYHKLKSGTEVSDAENVGILISSNVKMLDVIIPKVQPKIRLLSLSLLKRVRDAYVQGMLSLAEHVAHLNNGELCFLKTIHHHDDDDVRLLIAS